MGSLSIDKGWLAGEGHSFIQLNAIMGLRVGQSGGAAPSFDVEALVQGHWISLGRFSEERAASERLTSVLTELKHLFRYGH